MTSEHARRIAQDVADGIFGAGASETQRLGALAVSTITKLADLLDARDKISPVPTESGVEKPIDKPKARAAQAHDKKAAKRP